MHAHASGTEPSPPRIDGPAGAPLLVMHADLSCPDCALVMRRLEGIPLRIDLRHFVLRSRGVPALRAALAAEAAARQGAFWPLARRLLADQGRQELPDLWAHAAALELDVGAFTHAMGEQMGLSRIRAETTAAVRGGAAVVPGLFGSASVALHLASHGYEGPVVTPAEA